MSYQQMSFLREPESKKAGLPVFRGASLVSRIRLQECVRHLVMNVTCGLSSGESLARLNPDGLWLRMYGDCFQVNLGGSFEEYSGIFPTWGMMLDGVVTGLPMSEQFIQEKGLVLFAHTNSQRLERMREGTAHRGRKQPYEHTGGKIEDWQRLSNIYEPKLLRSHNGIANYVDRIKSLGNMVVPQQFYPIFRTIADMEELLK